MTIFIALVTLLSLIKLGFRIARLSKSEHMSKDDASATVVRAFSALAFGLWGLILLAKGTV